MVIVALLSQVFCRKQKLQGLQKSSLLAFLQKKVAVSFCLD